MKKLFASTIAILTLSVVASAQVVHTARSSKINYSYVYGAGGDVFQGNDLVDDQTLLATDFEQLMFSQSNSGFLNGNPWSAGVGTNQVHSYDVVGPSTNVQRFNALGQTDLFSHASGPGLAQIINTNPGNELVQSFTVVTSQSYYLNGEIDVPPSALPGNIVLQKWDGIVWQSLFNSWFLPGSTGPFVVNGTMAPGLYRIVAAIGENGFGNASKHCDYTYALDFFPFTLHLASSFQVVQGLHFGGNIASLQSSDDDPVIVLSEEFDSNGQIVFETTLPAGTTTELRISFEGKATRSDLSQFVRMFNFTTNSYVNASFQNSTLTDSIVNGSIANNVVQFVGPGGVVRADVLWIPQADIDSGDGWTEGCDFVQWTRVP